MLLYIYALADTLDDVSGLIGIAHEPLTLVPAADTVAVCGWIERAPPVDRDSLTAQDRLVRELHARAPALLPMRFGAAMAGVDALTSALRIFGGRLRADLDQVRGREQMTLRLLGATGAATTASRAEADTAGPGTRYLEKRMAESYPPEAAPLIDALRPFQRATRIERARYQGVLATVYQLIDRGSEEAYRQAVEAVRTQLPLLTIRLSGPSPAYAFANFSAP